MNQNKKLEQIEVIKRQVEDVLKEIDTIKNQTAKIRNAAELTAFEKDISKATDKLAGLLTAKAIQEALDSDEVKQQSKDLIESMPEKLEHQGLRDITIKPARGSAVTVKASYFTKKKRKKKRKKKKS